MKRLIRKFAETVFREYRRKRLMRYAEMVDVDMADPNLVQNITNVMASGGQIEIFYNNEWKTIFPYGWNTSKVGNILIMCYKDTGEVRSYRLDRTQSVRIDGSSLEGEGATMDQFNVPDSEVPELEEFDAPPDSVDEQFQSQTQMQQDLPFDGAIDVLNSEVPVEETNIVEEEPADKKQDS